MSGSVRAMKVYVRIGHGAKELYDDLELLSPRERAERLRVLASIGLSVVHGGHATGISVEKITPAIDPDVPADVSPRKSNIANSLMKSL